MSSTTKSKRLHYPSVTIHLDALRQNVDAVVGLCKAQGIAVSGVTKSFCAIPELAQILVAGGCESLADSRLRNLAHLGGFGVPRMLLRLPMISEADRVIHCADISLNSELRTVQALNLAAQKAGTTHGVILMMDLGDLREGYYDEYELFSAVGVIQDTLKNIEIKGLGVNLTCYGGILPDEFNLMRLVTIAQYVTRKYSLPSGIISGGNSSSLHLLLSGDMVPGINHLRIGEAFILGRETAFGQKIPGTRDDAFCLVAEIVEQKTKPTLPKGHMGKNAFGETPTFEDRGTRQVAICAIGKQDVDPAKLRPLDEGILILGASSDHLVLDVTAAATPLTVGNTISFGMAYGAILSAMTSPYVYKNLIP
ncbi:putative cytoplasmic protein [Clostridiaceae bacterium JG1575]|nr:putative cytoplasmic protein [Clostridiaceae bacterium JG1575]